MMAMPEQPRLHFREFATIGRVDGMPRILGVGHERQLDTGYYRSIGRRRGHHAVVQISLAGTGALWDMPGCGRHDAGWRGLPAGSAVVFIIGEDDLSYGFPPGAPAPWEFVWVNIGGEAALAMARGIIARGRVRPFPPRLSAVRSLLRLARSERRALTAATGCLLAGEVFAALAGPGCDDQAGIVGRAMALLDDPRQPGRSVREVAAALGVSREHLTRTFASSIGRSPARWLDEQRLARAEAMLSGSAMPVADVARIAGFGSAALLTRHFSACHGCTPAAYRRLLAHHT